MGIKQVAINTYEEYKTFPKLKKFGLFLAVGAIVLNTYNLTTGNHNSQILNKLFDNKAQPTQEYDKKEINTNTIEKHSITKETTLSNISKLRASYTNQNTNDATSKLSI